MLQDLTSTMEQRDDLATSWQQIIVGSEDPLWRIDHAIFHAKANIDGSLGNKNTKFELRKRFIASFLLLNHKFISN